MTTTEEWLRRGLGEGDDGPLPERLQPARLRRQARRTRRRRNTVGVAAVVIVAGLGLSQGERVVALRRPAPADTPPVVLVSPTASATAATPSPTAPTVSPTAVPSPAVATSATAPASPRASTGTITVTAIGLSQGETGKQYLTFGYRAPREVVVSGEGPGGAGGGTEGSTGPTGGDGEFVADFRPGRWTVKAVRLERGRSVTVATTEVDVPPLNAWPRVDDVSLEFLGRCGTEGPDVVLRFAPGAAARSAEVTLVVRPEKGGTGQIRRVQRLKADELTRPITAHRLSWPCEAQGYARSKNYTVRIVARDESGRYMEDELRSTP